VNAKELKGVPNYGRRGVRWTRYHLGLLLVAAMGAWAAYAYVGSVVGYPNMTNWAARAGLRWSALTFGAGSVSGFAALLLHAWIHRAPEGPETGLTTAARLLMYAAGVIGVLALLMGTVFAPVF
jgi:hypothetical protein